MSTIKAPEKLAELQTWMGAILASPVQRAGHFQIPEYEEALKEQIEEKITAGPHLNASQRLGIYHQQYWFRLFRILEKHYPSILHLFGTKDFRKNLAEKYLLEHRPKHWALSTLGNTFPQWMEKNYFDEDRDFILPMVYLDSACHFLPYIREKPAIQEKDLLDVFEKKLRLQPYIALFALSFDAFSFRTALLKKENWGEEDFPEIVSFSKKRYFVFSAGSSHSFCEEVSQEEHALLQRFQKGEKLEIALSSVSPHMPLTSWFEKWTKRSWLFLS